WVLVFCCSGWGWLVSVSGAGARWCWFGVDLFYKEVEVQPCVYMLASRRNGTLYIGVTSNLVRRVWEHKGGFVEGFSTTYQVHLFVWFELCDNMESAILREKRLKHLPRASKIELIESANPYWRDLYGGIL